MQADIRNNIQAVRERMEAAAARCGRKASDITLIAVSKLHSAEEVDAAADAGITDVGENKVQEIISKQPQVRSALTWHLIGHLQTNKVKSVIDKVSVIHSVDSFHLAQEIDRRAQQAGLVKDILLQVNAAHEETKFGLSAEETLPLAESIAEKLKNVRIRGLMQIAPYAEDPEDVRKYFRQVRELFEKLRDGGFAEADMLSMGMSHDFETAIEEGATHIRVGTAIFGERDYSKRNS